MCDANGIKEDIVERIKSDIEYMCNEIDVKNADNADLKLDFDLFKKMASDLKDNTSFGDVDICFRSLAKIDNMHMQLDIIESNTHMLQPPHTSQSSGQQASLITMLKQKLKNISSRLWQLIKQLTTIKEWSISGDIGLQLFGLTGTCRAQLTFGKP